MSIPRSLRAKAKQQTRLAFSPLPSSSPAIDQYPSAVQDRLANVRHTRSRNAPASSPPLPRPEIQPESLPPTPQPSSQLEPSIHPNESEEDPLPSTKRRRLARGSREEQITPTRKSTRLSKSSPLRRYTGSSSSGSDNGELPKASTLPELGEPETTGDEDDVLVTKPIQRRGQRKKVAEDPFVVDDDRVEYVPSDEASAPRVQTKPIRPTGDDWLAADDEIKYITSGDEVPQSIRRKVKKSKVRRRNRHEQEELEDDLADLRDSDHSEEATAKTPRTRGGPVTTQKDKAKEHFDLLKRRRAGEKVPRVVDSDEEGEYEEAEPVDIDNIAEDGLLGAPYEISDDDPEMPAGDFEAAEEDDFVVDDVPSRRLGLPHPDIPLEFTSYASAKPRDLFIHVIEWLVKNRIAPAFSRDDPIYKLSLSKVSDQVTAQAGSRLISSAWNAEFKYAILARPNIRMTYLDELEDGDDGIRTCDACNKTNHPARYDFVLSGQPYKKRDLEPVNDEPDDEDDDEDENSQDYDEAGHLLPSQSTHFYLGRFCAANAEMGHKLIHWQYHLNQSLLEYLEEQGVLSSEATLARDKLSRKKRENEADAVVDSMEETGVIKELWKGFQGDLDDARLGMEDFEKRGRRGQGRIGSVRSTGKDGLVREWNKDTVTIVGRVASDDEDD
jgi:hypothetical protein